MDRKKIREVDVYYSKESLDVFNYAFCRLQGLISAEKEREHPNLLFISDLERLLETYRALIAFCVMEGKYEEPSNLKNG